MTQTETSMTWLERIVRAHRGVTEANRHIATLMTVMRRSNPEIDPRAENALDEDGTGWKLQALRNRVATIEADLRQAECHGSTVGPILLALNDVNAVLNETILATGILLERAFAEPTEDPFIDRFEEHPAYERP